MTDAYTLWKTAHVISAAILFGTGFGIAFFAWFGYRRAIAGRDIGSLRSVLSLTVIADNTFTAPAVLFQAISGLVLMHLNSWPVLSPWSLTIFSLYVLVGMLWLPVVVVQIALKREAYSVASIEQLSVGFHRRFTLWFLLGIPAFILVSTIYYLMIAKPLALMGK